MRFIPLLVGFCLLVSACASSPPQTQTVSVPEQPKERPFYAEKPFYFDYNSFDPANFPPPPKEGSREDKADFAALDKFQKKRTQEMCDAASHEVKPDFENFYGELSPFVKPTPAEIDHIFWQLRSDMGRTVSRVKKFYNRERPYRRDEKRFVPCIKKEDGKAYPSGHAAFARLYSLVLAELDPANREKYEAHARQSALNRVIGGVHHPSDIAMGAKLADDIYAKMKESPAYKADIEKLRGFLLAK